MVGQESQSELEARVEEQIQEVRQTDAAQLTFVWPEKYSFITTSNEYNLFNILSLLRFVTAVKLIRSKKLM
jgi:hypothetical protein